MISIRDSEISAQGIGIDLVRTKSVAFAISAGFTGLAGGLFAHNFGYLSPDTFTILTSIQLLLMVVVGDSARCTESFSAPSSSCCYLSAIALIRDWLPPTVGQLPGLEPGLFGLVLVLFLIYEPLGINGRWRKIRDYFEAFPLYRKATHKRQRSYLRTERVK